MKRKAGFSDVSGVANRSDAVGRAGRLVPRQSCRFDVRVRSVDAGTPKNRVFTGACKYFLNSALDPNCWSRAVSGTAQACLKVQVGPADSLQ